MALLNPVHIIIINLFKTGIRDSFLVVAPAFGGVDAQRRERCHQHLIVKRLRKLSLDEWRTKQQTNTANN